MTRLTRAVLHFAVVLLAAGVWWIPTDAWAQAGDAAFKLGLEAVRDRKWDEAITHLRRAIAQDDRESTRRVQLPGGFLGFGRRESEYLPHYFLGEVLLQTNDCLGALEQWAISEQQGFVKSRGDLFKALQEGYRRCDARGFLSPADFNAARDSTRQAIDQAEGSEKRAGALAQANRDLVRPEVSESLEGARKELAGARGRLSIAEKGRTRSDFNEAKSSAERARATLVTIEATLNAGIRNRSAVDQQAADVERIIAGARETDREIEATGTTLTPALREPRQEGRQRLEEASKQLNDGRRAQNQGTVGEARTLATEAARSLLQVLEGARVLQKELLEKVEEGALKLRLDEAMAAARNALSFAEASFARLVERLQKRPDRATGELATERDDLQKRLNGLRPRLDRETEARNLLGVQGVTRSANGVRASLDKLTESFGPVTTEEQVGTALYAAAQSFIDGDYDATIKKLDSSSEPAGGPLQAHVHLFRAAALYALYVRSGEKDEALLTRTNGEIERGRMLDPALELDRRMFSPRFISIYRSGGIRPAAAPAAAPSQ